MAKEEKKIIGTPAGKKFWITSGAIALALASGALGYLGWQYLCLNSNTKNTTSLRTPQERLDWLYPMKLSFSKNDQDLLVWQERLRSRLENLLFLSETSSPIDVGVSCSETDTVGNYTLKEITYRRADSNRWIHARISYPLGLEDRLPAIIAFPGHNGDSNSVFNRGNKMVEIYGYGDVFAKMGYIVISPDVNYEILPEGEKSLMSNRIKDCLTTLNLLMQDKRIDKTRIGSVGLSLGGELAMWLAALDKRVKATLISGFLPTYQYMGGHGCNCWYVDRLNEVCDFSDIYGLIAPRPLVIEQGMKDKDIPIDVANLTYEKIEQIYAYSPNPENLVYLVNDDGHRFKGGKSVEVFDRFMRKK